MDTNDRKSMDDVLASIRRIVRTEKEDAVATGSADGQQGMFRRSSGSGEATSDEPLVLTPEMRADAAGADTDGASDPVPGAAAAPADGRGPDREELRAMLREMLRDELSDGGAAEDAVREIIRDELTNGQVASNVSENVLRLIRSEVARAQQPR